MKCETSEHDSSISWNGDNCTSCTIDVGLDWVLYWYRRVHTHMYVLSHRVVRQPTTCVQAASRPVFTVTTKAKPGRKEAKHTQYVGWIGRVTLLLCPRGVDLNDPGISEGTYLKEGGVSGTTTVDMSCLPRWVMSR